MSTTKENYPEITMLRAFLLTAKTGSFTEAAKLMKVSQPAISTAIARLESFAGTPLFNRTARPIQLTPAGHHVRRRIEPIIEDLYSLSSEIKSFVSDAAIDLRIGFSDSFGACVTPLLMPRLLPRVDNLAAYCQSSPKIVRQLVDGMLDIVVATKFPSENPTITAQMLMSEKFLIVTPKQFEGKITQKVDLNLLPKNLPVIRFNDDSLDSVQIERVLRQCNFHGGRSIAVDTNQSAMNLVANGIGWTILPPLGIWAAKDFLPAVSLHNIDSLHSTRQFYVQYQFAAYELLAQFIFQESQALIQSTVIPAMEKASSLLASAVSLTNF